MPLLNVAASRGLVAVAFSNVCIFGPTSFQCLDTVIECGLASLVDSRPAAFQVPFSPGSVNSTRRKPSLQTRPPNPPGNSPRVCAYGANVAAICLFGGNSLPVALRIEARPAPLRLAVAGVGSSALRGLFFQSPNIIYQSQPFFPTLRHHRPSAPEHPCFLAPGKKSRRAAVCRNRDRFRRGGAFRFYRNRLFLALRSATATALPGRRWLRSSRTTHQTLARGIPTPKDSPR